MEDERAVLLSDRERPQAAAVPTFHWKFCDGYPRTGVSQIREPFQTSGCKSIIDGHLESAFLRAFISQRLQKRHFHTGASEWGIAPSSTRIHRNRFGEPFTEEFLLKISGLQKVGRSMQSSSQLSSSFPEETLELPAVWVSYMSFGSSLIMHLTALALLAIFILPHSTSSGSTAVRGEFLDTVVSGDGFDGLMARFDGGMDPLGEAPAATDASPAEIPMFQQDPLAAASLPELDRVMDFTENRIAEGALAAAVPAGKSGKAGGTGKGAASGSIGGKGSGSGTGSGKGNSSGNGIGGSGNGTGTGKGGFFGLKVAGKSTVFVVDASKSMNLPHPGPSRTRFNRVKLELLRTISRMTENEKFFITFFGDGAYPMPADRIMEAELPVRRRYLMWMMQVQATGHTFPEQALLLALQLQPDQIYFLTDGDFDYSVAPRVTAANLEGIPIHTIGFSDNRGENLLMEIARRNNGTYTYIPPDEPEGDEGDAGDSAAAIISALEKK